MLSYRLTLKRFKMLDLCGIFFEILYNKAVSNLLETALLYILLFTYFEDVIALSCSNTKCI